MEVFSKNIVGKKLYVIEYPEVIEYKITDYNFVNDRILCEYGDKESNEWSEISACLRVDLNRSLFFDEDLAKNILKRMKRKFINP